VPVKGEGVHVTLAPGELAGSAPQALELFCSFLGNVAGNLAPMLGARAGVHIGGGIARRVIDEPRGSRLRERFDTKGRFSGHLSQIPTFVISGTTSPALPGALLALDAAAWTPKLLARRWQGLPRWTRSSRTLAEWRVHRRRCRPAIRTDPRMTSASWPRQIFDELKALHIRQVAYVPDAGHAELIGLCHAEPAMRAVSLTTEEEGVALLAGAWLGGERGVLLLQSSGVGNCVNMLSLQHETRMPLVMIVTMRGEWGEFNPWQVAMGQSTRAVLQASGVLVYRADAAEEVAPQLGAGARLAFQTGRSVAVLIGQRVVGSKNFHK
jgi:sulfopyruvate decarboxylase alpha subunit